MKNKNGKISSSRPNANSFAYAYPNLILGSHLSSHKNHCRTVPITAELFNNAMVMSLTRHACLQTKLYFDRKNNDSSKDDCFKKINFHSSLLLIH